MSINGIEWIIILIAALLLFGPKKLPQFGRALGKMLREFRQATSGMLQEEEHKSELSEKSTR